MKNDFLDGRCVRISNGYEDVHFPEHPNARNNGNIYVHILAAESKLGRYLRAGEVVHHVDFNKRNNDPSNLMVFASSADHSFYHGCLRNPNIDYMLYRIEGVYHCTPMSVLDTSKSKVVNVKGFEVRVNLCKMCGKPIYMYGKNSMCSKCLAFTHRKVDRPSRDELKSLIRNSSFLFIARKYGVSDTAIRKWCISYNLPFNSGVIKSISDQEWDKI